MRAAAPIAVAALLAGCGYKAGLTLPEGHHSVGIEIFGNDSMERDVEREVHAALSRSVRELVHAPLSAPDQADLVIDGRVTEFRRWAGIRGKRNVLLESGMTIAVEAWLEDRASGERVRSVLSSRRIGYVLAEENGERKARERAVSYIAEDVVLELFTPAAQMEGDS